MRSNAHYITVILSPEEKIWLYEEAKRQDRAVAWLVRKALKIARAQLEAAPPHPMKEISDDRRD